MTVPKSDEWPIWLNTSFYLVVFALLYIRESYNLLHLRWLWTAGSLNSRFWIASTYEVWPLLVACVLNDFLALETDCYLYIILFHLLLFALVIILRRSRSVYFSWKVFEYFYCCSNTWGFNLTARGGGSTSSSPNLISVVFTSLSSRYDFLRVSNDLNSGVVKSD